MGYNLKNGHRNRKSTSKIAKWPSLRPLAFKSKFIRQFEFLDNLEDLYTPNANMADHSVVARDELHESEVSQSSMFCFESASPENSCFVVALFCFISLCLRVAVFLNAT